MIEKRPKLIRDAAYPGREQLTSGLIGEMSLVNLGVWQFGSDPSTRYSADFIKSRPDWFVWVDFCAECKREVCGKDPWSHYACRLCHSCGRGEEESAIDWPGRCPFCGMFAGIESDVKKLDFCARCAFCGASGPRALTVAKAVAAWGSMSVNKGPR